MASANVIPDRTTEKTVPMGLNMETKTGPLFFIAHPLKLTHAPLTAPLCEDLIKRAVLKTALIYTKPLGLAGVMIGGESD